MAASNALLLAAELLLYFGVLATLLHLRRHIGIGVFTTALGAMHFLETYLASVLYVGLPGGFVTSPGSSILFAGKLVMLLLVYIQEDATTVRQPIYGLLAGNVMVIVLVMLLRHHQVVAAPGREPDLQFLNDMGWLMVWGSALLYVDSIAIVLLYERFGSWLGGRPTFRIWLSAALVLTFDQIGFYAALHLLFDAPFSVFVGGLLGKMASVAAYALLAGLYLRFADRGLPFAATETRLADVFGKLTYRERYQALLEAAGRDALTGALNRNRLEAEGRQAASLALASGRSVSLVLVDLDRFKSINDRFGHPAGDEALRRAAAAIQDQLSAADYLFRYGGDEFLILATGLEASHAVGLASRVGRAVADVTLAGSGEQLSASVGVATGPGEGASFAGLLTVADERLYASKRIGRYRQASLDEMLSAMRASAPRDAA